MDKRPGMTWVVEFQLGQLQAFEAMQELLAGLEVALMFVLSVSVRTVDVMCKKLSSESFFSLFACFHFSATGQVKGCPD